MAFNWLLRILDRYAVRAPIKGGFTWWNPKHIFITCPRLPCEEFVRHSEGGNVVYEDIEQINRRCDEILQWNARLKIFVPVR